MKQRINAFLNDYKKLCDHYGLELTVDYDEYMYLTDKEGNQVSEHIDLTTYTALPYVVPAPKPRDPNAKPMTLADFQKAALNTIEKAAVDALNSESAFSKIFEGRYSTDSDNWRGRESK